MKSTLHLIVGLANNTEQSGIDCCLVPLTPGYLKWLLARKREFDNLRSENITLYQLEHSFPPVSFGVSDYRLECVTDVLDWFVCPDIKHFTEEEVAITCKHLSITSSGVFWTCLDKFDTDKAAIETPELAWQTLIDLKAGRKPLKQAVTHDNPA